MTQPTVAEMAHLIGVLDTVRKEREAARKERDEFKVIIKRLWAALGNPSYESLDGKDIVDLVCELRNDRDTLAAALDDQGHSEVCIPNKCNCIKSRAEAILAAHDVAKDAEIAALRDQISIACADAETVGYYGDQLDSAITCFRDRITALVAEIVALAAGLHVAHEQMRTAGWQPDVIESTVGLDACKRALEEHDAALVKPLVEALKKYSQHLQWCAIWVTGALSDSGREPCACGLSAALAPYKEAADVAKD